MQGTPKNFAELVGEFIGILSLIVPLIFGLTLLFFIWKIVDSWVINAAEPKKVEEGKQYALVGVIVLVVMSGIWAIVNIIQSSFFGI